MTNELLDEILQKLNDQFGINGTVAGNDFLHSLSGDADMDAVRFLESSEFVKIHYTNIEARNLDTPYWHLSLTAKGAKFIMDGGYTKKAFLREEPIRIAQQSNTISSESLTVAKRSLDRSTLAIIVSIAAIIVTVVIFLLQSRK